MWLPHAQRDAAHHQLHASLRPAQHRAAEEVTMKPPARSIVTAVALAALSVLAIGSAHAYPADPTDAGERFRQGEVNSINHPPQTTPNAGDLFRQGEVDSINHPQPAPNPQQHANPSRAPIVLAVTGAVGLSVLVVAAAARGRRRARSRPREAI
jgi:hypothetical protein